MVAPLVLLPLVFVGVSFFLGIISAAVPGLSTALVEWLNLPENVYALLIEIPRPAWDASFGPQIAGAPGGIYTNSSGYSNIIGPAMTSLYAGSRLASFLLLAFVVMFAAFAYFLQNFRLVSEGAAARILTGSVMTVILILVFPLLYDTVAATINTLTYPGPSSIIPPDAITTILSTAASVSPGINWSNPMATDVAGLMIGAIMNLFLMIFTLTSYIAVAVLGLLRTFFIGAAFALMPVLLVIRLMPYVDRVADLFIQVIVGGTLVSVIVAFFFNFGYAVITTATISALFKTLMALGVLLASSLMMTVLIPHLGALMGSISNTITGAATGAAVGGAAVLSSMASAGLSAAPSLTAAVGAGQLSGAGAALRSIGTSTLAGLGTLGSAAPRMAGLGAIGGAVPAALSIGRSLGTHPLLSRSDIFAEEPAYADAIILDAAATPHALESGDAIDAARLKEYAEMVRRDILTRPPEVLGEDFAKMTGLRVEDKAEVGERIKSRLENIVKQTGDTPDLQDKLLARIGQQYNYWKDNPMSAEKLNAVIGSAKKNADRVAEMIQKAHFEAGAVPGIANLDSLPDGKRGG